MRKLEGTGSHIKLLTPESSLERGFSFTTTLNQSLAAGVELPVQSRRSRSWTYIQASTLSYHGRHRPRRRARTRIETNLFPSPSESSGARASSLDDWDRPSESDREGSSRASSRGDGLDRHHSNYDSRHGRYEPDQSSSTSSRNVIPRTNARERERSRHRDGRDESERDAPRNHRAEPERPVHRDRHAGSEHSLDALPRENPNAHVPSTYARRAANLEAPRATEVGINQSESPIINDLANYDLDDWIWATSDVTAYKR